MTVLRSLSLLSDACQHRNFQSWLDGCGLLSDWVVTDWVRRLVRGLVGPTTTNTTHQQHFLVKRCASANKPSMVGGWVQVGGFELVGEWVAGCVGWCVNWLVPPPTPPSTNNISLLSHARQRNNLVLQWVGGCEGGGSNQNNQIV